MGHGTKPLLLEEHLARILRIAFGITVLGILLVVFGASGANAATGNPAGDPASTAAPSRGGGLLSGILNPIVKVVDQTLGQVPVVQDITGDDTVGTLIAPVTGVTDQVENTLASVPVADAVITPAREVTTAVVPPVVEVVSGIARPVLGVVDQVTAPVVEIAAPILDPVTETLNPVVDGVAGGAADVVDHVVDTVVTPILPVTPQVPAVPETPTTPLTPAAPAIPDSPAAPAVPVAPATPATPSNPVAQVAPVAPVDAVTPAVPAAVVTAAAPANVAPQLLPDDPATDSGSPARAALAANTESFSAGTIAPAAVRGTVTAAEYLSANGPLGRPATSSSVPNRTHAAMLPVGGPATANCDSDESGIVVGPCISAMPVAATSGTTTTLASGGSGGAAGSAAAHENLPTSFSLAGKGAALPDADWPLPASMPSDPGSTPG